MGNRHVRFWRPVASVRTAAEFNHFLGPKQRCWAHLLRDLDKLRHEHAQDTETVACQLTAGSGSPALCGTTWWPPLSRRYRLAEL
jgi:hypothetical protein